MKCDSSFFFLPRCLFRARLSTAKFYVRRYFYVYDHNDLRLRPLLIAVARQSVTRNKVETVTCVVSTLSVI